MNASTRQFSRRMQLVYAGQFLVIGAYMPFMPVWLAQRGLTPVQIGVVLTLPMLARTLLAPAITYAIERRSRRGRALAVLAALAGLATLLLLVSRGYTAILAATAALSLFWCAIMPLAEASAMEGVRRRGLDYGRMRLWGSISFIAANLGAGYLVDLMSVDAALALIALSFMVTGWFAFGLPAPRREAENGDAFSRQNLTLLVRIPFLLAIAVAALLQSSHMLIYGFGTLHWQSLGYPNLLIGALWAIGVIAEIGLFAFSGAVVRAVGAWPLLLVAALAAVLRWAIMPFDPPLGLLVVLQTLHGLTFGATHLAIVNLVADAVPAELGGTAQSIMYALASLAGSLAMLGAGVLYAAYGAGAFWAMSGLALGGLVLASAGLLAQMRQSRSS